MNIIEFFPVTIAAAALLMRIGMAVNDSRNSRNIDPAAPARTLTGQD